MDGFYLSFTREPVEVPSAEQVRVFLPPFPTGHAEFCASRPTAQGVAVLGGPLYSYIRHQMHLAARNALTVHEGNIPSSEECSPPRDGWRIDQSEL